LRFIDKASLVVTKAWIDKAERLTSKLEELDRTDSARFRKLRNEVLKNACWSELKAGLVKLSSEKCWYCEAKIDREYGAVDHFRPKAGVTGEDDHLGYWWLAYDPSNYRLSCTICNSPSAGGKGKHNWFPLLPGSPRAFNPGEEINERVEILDPCVSHEPALMIFDMKGRPQPAITEATDVVAHRRVLESIRVYNLDKSSTCKLRKELMVEVDDAVNIIQQIEQVMSTLPAPEPELEASVNAIKTKIVNKITPEAVFSTAPASALMYRRSDAPWVDDLLRQGGFLLET
jgi:uncharacterized protein (TIGR02646 family)